MTTNPQPEGGMPLAVSYDDQKCLARSGSRDERCALAGRADVRPEILYYLAGDADAAVRRHIARNDVTPRHADLLLSRDEDDRVRSELAGKIAQAGAQMVADERSNVYRITMQALEILAGDQLVRIRQILAETLKQSPGAPRPVMERLARDADISVAGPVLEHSPVLSDAFLISILDSDPVQGSLQAISRRVALGEDVADAIVGTGDADAIAELLGNESAQIREETLDRIVDQAPGRPTWHAPLVGRPRLHLAAVRRLAAIVTAPLLAELKRQAHLDDATMAMIDEAIRRRLDGTEMEDLANVWRPGAQKPPVADPSWADRRTVPTGAKEAPGAIEPDWALEAAEPDDEAGRARALFDAGTLSEQCVSDALADGHAGFVIQALALLAGVPEEVVRKTSSVQNAKAIVALAWKAGLSMRLATRLQMHLAAIPPSGVLRATATEGYPMSPEEMSWQLEFVAGVPGGA